jgi:arylsulfatase A-like enzyme
MDGARKDRTLKAKNYSKLIENSLFFSTVIAYAPFTIAAMHAIFSGTYGTKTGVNSYWSNINFKKDDYKTLPLYLQDKNYVTHADVINKLVLPPLGFDEFVIHDELNDDLTQRHIQLIDKFNKIRKNGKNFFLYLHYSNIHTGIMQEVLKKYDNFSKEYFQNRTKNEKFYDELFSSADDYLGKIIEHCQNLNLFYDTLLVVVSDHGISTGEKLGERAYGVFCYDYTLVSTALFHHKKLPSTKINQQVRSIDILPTILEIMNIPIDKNFLPLQGTSLLSLNNQKPVNNLAFSQSGNPLGSTKPPKEPNVYSIRTNDWKYIRNIHNDSEEVYNLIDDPHENNNLIDMEKQKTKELRSELDRILNS